MIRCDFPFAILKAFRYNINDIIQRGRKKIREVSINNVATEGSQRMRRRNSLVQSDNSKKISRCSILSIFQVKDKTP